jgi:hypothetical protein
VKTVTKKVAVCYFDTSPPVARSVRIDDTNPSALSEKSHNCIVVHITDCVTMTQSFLFCDTISDPLLYRACETREQWRERIRRYTGVSRLKHG